MCLAQYDANGTDRNNLFLDLHNNTYIEIAMSLSKSIFRKFHPKIAIPIIKENICNRELDIQLMNLVIYIVQTDIQFLPYQMCYNDAAV